MADNRSENREIKRMGGKAQKNSGRGQYQKGDARLFPFIVDVKEYAESFSVSRKNWAKLQTDTMTSDRSAVPAFSLVLGNDDHRLRLWVVHDDMFHEMREAWLEKYGDQDDV